MTFTEFVSLDSKLAESKPSSEEPSELLDDSLDGRWLEDWPDESESELEAHSSS